MTDAASWAALAGFATWTALSYLREWREASRLRTILAGREKPPSVEEMQAHAATHPWAGDTSTGRWLVRAPDAPNGAEASAVMMLRVLPDGRCFAATIADDWSELPDNPSGKHAPDSRWWPLDRSGTPTTWPVTP